MSVAGRWVIFGFAVVLGAPALAYAGNGTHPRTPVLWEPAPECLTIVDRTVDAKLTFNYTIPYEDTEPTADEVDDSRRHQFLAFCHGHSRQEPLPVWIAVGGTPESVIRAGTLGLPMVLAIIGGEPARFKPFTDLYKQVWRETGHDPSKFQLGIGSHGFIADTTEEAAELIYPRYAMQMGRIGKERGWGPVGRSQFDFEISPNGAMLLGDPETVAKKIIREHELFGFTRFSLQFSVGSVPHEKLLRCIELYATKVVPMVKAAIASS